MIQGKVSINVADSALMEDKVLRELAANSSHCVIPSASQGIASIASWLSGVGVVIGSSVGVAVAVGVGVSVVEGVAVDVTSGVGMLTGRAVGVGSSVRVAVRVWVSVAEGVVVDVASGAGVLAGCAVAVGTGASSHADSKADTNKYNKPVPATDRMVLRMPITLQEANTLC